MKNRYSKVTAILKADKKVTLFINQCLDIVNHMSGNEGFINPPVAYADVITAIKNLRYAEDMARMRTIGAAQERDNQKENVMKFMRRIHLFIQELADEAKTEKMAKELILASGFSIKKSSYYPKSIFSVKQDLSTGELILRAKSAGKRATYEWQVSVNNGESFVNLPATLKARTVVSDFIPYQKIHFRFRSLTQNGLSEWSFSEKITPMDINDMPFIPEKRK